jgi:hypothetical protein
MRTIIIASLLCVALCIGSMSGSWKNHNFDSENNEIDKLVLQTALKGVKAQQNSDASF